MAGSNARIQPDLRKTSQIPYDPKSPESQSGFDERNLVLIVSQGILELGLGNVTARIRGQRSPL